MKSIWTRPVFSPSSAYVERFASVPAGGRAKMLLAGIAFALIPIVYGIYCLATGHATLLGRSGSRLSFSGDSATSLAVAYIALGFFFHFHWFWGIHPRLQRYCESGKILSLLVFLSSLAYALYAKLSLAV